MRLDFVGCCCRTVTRGLVRCWGHGPFDARFYREARMGYGSGSLSMLLVICAWCCDCYACWDAWVRARQGNDHMSWVRSFRFWFVLCKSVICGRGVMTSTGDVSVQVILITAESCHY